MFEVSSYTIGWVCALTGEYVAAREFLDEEHDQAEYVSAYMDHNTYTFGTVGKHNVVIAVMPRGEYGSTSAATVARDMIRSFPKLRIGVMVGIAGGAPSKAHDIRLGDVVVSSPSRGKGGVHQYDYGKTVQARKFQRTGHLNSPPTSLLTAMADLEARIQANGHDIENGIQTILSKKPRLRRSYGRPDGMTDRLYASTFVHQTEGDCEDTCANAIGAVCQRVERDEYQDNPSIHYGLVASANQLMKDATVRDALADELNILCFEMEAAGLMNQFPFLVIRGICDYADSHKNKQWQGYAAMTAAAYARLLLNRLAPNRVVAERPIGDILQSIEKTVDAVHKTSQSLDEAVKNEAITRWLSAPNPSENHNSALYGRHPNTGLWCLESTQYREWKANLHSCLWLHGVPGCGKTVLSSTIIEDLQKGGYTVLYFYFDFNDKHKQSFENMVRSLTWQLYRRDEKSRWHLNQLYSSCDAGKDQPQRKSLIETYDSMAGEVQNLKIVLDALDECVTMDQLLDWLASVGPRRVQVLLTSRELDEIKSSLTLWIPPTAIMPIQSTHVNEDIRLLVRSKLLGDREFRQRWQSIPGVYERVETKFMEKADGMFLWAACQICPLRRCLDRPTLDKALLSLPKDLSETYGRVLANIPDEDRRQAVRLLQFLVFARRPLRLEEAVDVIAVFPERMPAFEKENRTRKSDEIVRYCSSLTKITTRTPTNVSTAENKTITELQLAHSSVMEYLVSNHIEQSFKHDFTSSRASAVIVEVSLAYLFAAAHSPYTDEVGASLPFMRSAAGLWTNHAMLAEDDESARGWINKLFTVRRAFEYWHSVRFRREGNFMSFCRSGDEIPDPLFHASQYGAANAVAQLIENDANVNCRSEISGRALEVAAQHGYEKIVKMLLPEYAKLDVNAHELHLNNALQEASREGHKSIVELLIRQGADVNVEGANWGFALCAASLEEDEEIMELLIDKGADPDAYSNCFGTALQIVSNAGNGKLVKTLLDKGADPNFRGASFYGNALYAAAVRGHKDTVEMLLERKAFTNMQGPHTNALYAAACQGHEDIVELLLDWGADVNVQGGCFSETLAEEGGFEEEEDADNTPLQVAAGRGHDKIVRMLLAKSAEVNAQGGYYGTALQAASLDGNERVVQILLDNDAMVNAQGGHFGSALQAASYAGHHKIVSMLIASGADVNADGGYYGNAFQAALCQGYVAVSQELYPDHQKVVELLIAHGAKY